MELRYCTDIQIGDLVAISEGNYQQLGFYCGNGIGNTFQYYNMYQLSHVHDKMLEDPEYKIKLFKGYVTANHDSRYVRIHPGHLNDEYKEKYYKSLEVLKKINIVKS